MQDHLLDSGRLPPAPVADARTEDPAIDLNALVAPFVGAAVVGLTIALLALLVLALIQARRIGKLRRRLDGLTRGADGASLGAVLESHVDKIYDVARELDDLSARSAVLEANSRRAIQRVGLVRFNPFEETGGNQSFALALTDAAGDGFVVSSLHARSGTRLYAKSVVAGRSDAALSAEESEALRQALATPVGRPRGGAPGRRDRAGAAV